MTPQLSDDQRQALADSHGEPVVVVDSVAQTQYVLIPAAVYQQLRSLLGDGEFDVKDAAHAQSLVAGAAGWDDPAMDVYNDLARRPQP